VGGAPFGEMEAAIEAAIKQHDAERVTVAVLPSLTADTVECRVWRMKLQRRLRATANHRVSVEYERWRHYQVAVKNESGSASSYPTS
jgi:hypothetical protein